VSHARHGRNDGRHDAHMWIWTIVGVLLVILLVVVIVKLLKK
jgi:hypothetical protein